MEMRYKGKRDRYIYCKSASEIEIYIPRDTCRPPNEDIAAGEEITDRCVRSKKIKELYFSFYFTDDIVKFIVIRN